MTWRVVVLLAGIGVLYAQDAPPKPPVEDEVTAYLAERRAPGLRAMALNDLYTEANRSLSQGLYREAEESFRSLMQQEPEDARGMSGVARVYLAENRDRKAVTLLQSESARQPKRVDILVALADTARVAGEYELALSALNRAQEQSPTEVYKIEILNQFTEVYRANGDMPSAIASMRKVYALKPNDTHTVLVLSELLTDIGETEEAQKIYSSLFLLPTHTPVTKQIRETQPPIIPDLNEALERAKLVVRLTPDDPLAVDQLASIYLDLGMSQETVALLQSTIARMPTVAILHFHLARAYLQLGDTDSASAQYQAALSSHPTDEELKAIRLALAQMSQRKQ